jgi:DNA-binding IclR family transcriptional regulator
VLQFDGMVGVRATGAKAPSRATGAKRVNRGTPADARNEPVGGSLRRALRVIGLVGSQPGIGLPALAAGLGVHKSTASRLCATLVQAGLVELENDGGRVRYRLGLWLFVLGSRAVASLELKRQAPRIMQRLAQETRLPVYLTVVWNGLTICVEEAPGPAGSVWLGSSVGVPHPLYATATGKLYLASLPVAEAAAYAATLDYRPLASRTLSTPEALLAAAASAREMGYAFNDEETEYGIRYLGVPVTDAHGRFIATMTIGAMVEQRTRDALLETLPFLRAGAAALGGRLATSSTAPAPPLMPAAGSTSPPGQGAPRSDSVRRSRRAPK